MSPDRWEQVEALFGGALEQPAEQRTAYLAAATGDADAKSDAQSLLLAHEAGGRFDSIVAQLCGLDPTAMSPPLLERLLVEQLSSLRAALGERYTIDRELGRGGMATVYLAEDIKHHRSVALKVLHPDLVANLVPERFRREIAIAAKLQHPHILTVLDSGDTPSGQLWFTMPYIDGESLRERLRREAQLSVEDTVRITRALAGALDYAHQHGVIHRDIKPENVLLTRQGDALLADFGIARVLTGTGGGEPARTSLTAAGVTVGTLQYMSPEQASAERQLTSRSDIYSLGAAVYEMLAGEPPFTGRTLHVVMAKMLSSEPPSVRRSRPGVSEAIDAALRRALASVPADRWATAGEFAAALERGERTTRATAAAGPRARAVPRSAVILGLSLLIGVGALFGWRTHTRSDGTASTSGPIRLAVLPFDNVGDSADAYFSDGLADAVRGKLAAISGLEVIASMSSGQYRHTTESPRQIAQELGVRYLLVGKVRWARASAGTPSRVEVSPELIEASSATDKWGAPFDAPVTDVFQVQADIAGEVAQQLKVTLTPAAQQTLAKQPTISFGAYDAYLRGQDIERAGLVPATLRRAAAAYREAIRRDSTFAPAWATLALDYALIYARGVPSRALGDSAQAAAATAVALDPNLAAAHAAAGAYFLLVQGDLTQALTEYSAALALSPNYVPALRGTALTEETLGRWETAEGHLQQAVRLDPRDGDVAGILGHIELFRRNYPAAQAELQQALSLQPGNVTFVGHRVEVALAQGDLAAARGIIQGALARIDTTALVTYLATYDDLGWVLDAGEERVLLGLGLAAFDNDVGSRALALAQQYAFRDDTHRSRAYADTARAAFETTLKGAPTDPQQHVLLGLTLAYLGHRADAVREGEHGVALLPISKDAVVGPYVQHQLVRIYMLVGEPEKALDALAPLLKVPYYISPGWLKIDPNFASLRGNPRFERLITQPVK